MKNLDSDDFYGVKHDESASSEIDQLKSFENQKQTDSERGNLKMAINQANDMIKGSWNKYLRNIFI